MRRSSAKRSLMPPLTMSFSSTTPRTRLPSATTSGGAAAACHFVHGLAHLEGQLAAQGFHVTADRITRTLADAASGCLHVAEVHAAHAGSGR